MKILCVLPHCDDEIGLIPLLIDRLHEIEQVDFLFVTYDKLRLLESKRYLNSFFSNTKMKFDILKGDNFIDGELYKDFDRLSNIIGKLVEEYDTICCPNGERGHQDHDCVFLSVVRNRNKKRLVFNLYRSNKFLYYEGFSKKFSNLPDKKLFKVRSKINFTLIRNLGFFKSQSKQLIMLIPFYIYRMFTGFTYAMIDPGKTATLDNNTPLYFKRAILNKKEFQKLFHNKTK